MPLTMSVNLSARQFYREDLAQRISEIVRGVGCEPSWIELEVTETSLLHDLDAIRKVLHQLRDEGFTVAIDDFGTGYSSLTHLKHFPIDTLKIDISFIADLETDPRRRGDHRGDHRPRARPRPEGRRRGRGHEGAARLPRRARLPLLPGLSGSASRCPAERVRRVRARTPKAAARLTRSCACLTSVCQPARASASRRLLPLALEHQHVREARHDDGVDAVMARGRARRRPACRCGRRRRPARTPACRRARAAASAAAATGRAARAAIRRPDGRVASARISGATSSLK